MRKITFFILLSLVCLKGKAALPYDWNNFFAASAINSGGTTLETGVSGVLNTWYNGSVTGGANPTLVTPSDLSYTDGTSANYIDNNTGKAIYINSPATARNSIFYLTSAGYTTGTYYVSFLLNVASGTAPSVTTLLMNFNQSSTGSSAYGRIYIKQSTNNTGFVLTTNSYNGNVSVASSELSYGTTHLIILKYVMSASPASAQAFLFIDPTLAGSEGTPTLTADAYTTGALTVKGLVIQSIPSFNGKIAGLRLSSTWADAAKAASVATPLSTPTGITTTSTGSSSFSASWDAVAGAASYSVKTYIGGTNLINTTNVASGTSTTVSGLMSGLDYTYKVIAIGDGVTNGDSPASSPISVSTTGKVASITTDFSDIASWGSPTATVPATGAFPSSTLNGFNLNAALLTTNTYKGPKGESHTNRISLDKLTALGSVTLPTVNSVSQLEIHFNMGTALNTINVKEYNPSNNTWTLVGTYTYEQAYKDASLDQILVIPFASPHTNAKFRIENNSSGACSIYQIITRTTNPTLLTTVTNGVADAIEATSATLNWTPVSNANGGYKVYLYKSTTLQSGYPISVSGQSSGNTTISGITPNTVYNYKVQAIGNGDVDFSDSYLSTTSFFTTVNSFSVSGTTSAASLTTLDASSNVSISNGSTLNIDALKSVNSVTVDAGGKLNIAAGNPLTVGTLTLKADKDITTFSSKIDAAITATTVRFFKTIDDTKWYFMSFPCNVTVNSITKSNGDAMTGLGVDWFIKYYDGNKRSIDGVTNGTNWVSVTGDGTLMAKKGYIFGLRNGMPETELLIPLNPSILAAETESTVPVLSYSTGGAAEVHKGWNLIGQPYLSRYDSQTGSDAAYMVVPNADGKTYTVKSKALSTLPQVDPFAAYFIQSAIDGNVTFGLTGRQSVRSLVDINQSNNIKLNLTTQTGKDETYLILDDIQSPSYQIGQDMEKWIGTGTEKPQIYTVLNGINYAFNALPAGNITNLPIGIYTKTAGATTISIDASQTTGITAILLKDNVNGSVTDILSSEYNFVSDAGTNNGRFEITIQKMSTGRSTLSSTDKATLSVKDGQLLIKNTDNQTKVKVYDIVGHLLIEKQSKNEQTIIPLNGAGVYTVIIDNGVRTRTEKIVL